MDLERRSLASVDGVNVSFEMIAPTKTFSTLLTLIRPLARVCPQMLSIILLGEELFPALLAPVQLLLITKMLITRSIFYLWALI